jgi:3-dehydroquinate dehydratase II
LRIDVLNGVNIDVIGRRDPAQYGGLSLSELETRIYSWGNELGIAVRCRHTNHEGEYIGWCHDLYDGVDGAIVNPGAWSHYAWSIRDALEPAGIPVVEVHLSNIDEREEWRRFSVLDGIRAHRIVGRGPDGYREALEYLQRGVA